MLFSNVCTSFVKSGIEKRMKFFEYTVKSSLKTQIIGFKNL